LVDLSEDGIFSPLISDDAFTAELSIGAASTVISVLFFPPQIKRSSSPAEVMKRLVGPSQGCMLIRFRFFFTECLSKGGLLHGGEDSDVVDEETDGK
jgi:hypothetical protein